MTNDQDQDMEIKTWYVSTGIHISTKTGIEYTDGKIS